MPERRKMTEKTEYNPTTHTGVDTIDRKAIHLALQSGERLTIDRYGHIYDNREHGLRTERSAKSMNALYMVIENGQESCSPSKG